MAEGLDTFLLGPATRDAYLPGGPVIPDGGVLPGGGALNMAWHWKDLGFPFFLITRVGAEDGSFIVDFLDRNGIAHSKSAALREGRTAAIDIEILPDRQPHMDNYVEGVFSAIRLDGGEEALLRAAKRLHAVLVEGAIAEIGRLGRAGILAGLEVSADFLDFRHYSLDRFAGTMRDIDLGFVGWPGDAEAPEVHGMREVAFDLRRLLVVTMGARSIRVFDGREGRREHSFPVKPVPVRGTTLGCGDAFIAGFLAEYWKSRDLVLAVAAGSTRGALATSWRCPLPDEAYGREIEYQHGG